MEREVESLNRFSAFNSVPKGEVSASFNLEAPVGWLKAGSSSVHYKGWKVIADVLISRGITENSGLTQIKCLWVLHIKSTGENVKGTIDSYAAPGEESLVANEILHDVIEEIRDEMFIRDIYLEL